MLDEVFVRVCVETHAAGAHIEQMMIVAGRIGYAAAIRGKASDPVHCVAIVPMQQRAEHRGARRAATNYRDMSHDRSPARRDGAAIFRKTQMPGTRRVRSTKACLSASCMVQPCVGVLDIQKTTGRVNKLLSKRWQ